MTQSFTAGDQVGQDWSSRLLVPHQRAATRIGSPLFQYPPTQATEQPRQLDEIARDYDRDATLFS
jgi:hypothetical protein